MASIQSVRSINACVLFKFITHPWWPTFWGFNILAEQNKSLWIKNFLGFWYWHQSFRQKYLLCVRLMAGLVYFRSLCHDVGPRFGKTCSGCWTSWNHAGMSWCGTPICSSTRAIREANRRTSIYTGSQHVKLTEFILIHCCMLKDFVKIFFFF